jgi:hypothetical protein
MSCKNFYVYRYNNEDGTPFYIGKGSKNRINESHAPWIIIPSIEFREIITDNLTEQDAFNLELKLIHYYKRKIDGGILENLKITRWVAQAGWKHSEETKKQISQKNTGKVRTAEQKENYKKSKTAQHAEKIKQANLGRVDDGRAVKISQTMKNKKWFTNGITCVFCEIDFQPLGFKPGRIIRKKEYELA